MRLLRSHSTQVVLPGGLGNQLFALAFCLNLISQGHQRVDLIARHYRWYRDHEVEIESLIDFLSQVGPVPTLRRERPYVPIPLERFLFSVPKSRSTLRETSRPLSPSSVKEGAFQVVRGYFQDAQTVDALEPGFLDVLRSWLGHTSAVGMSLFETAMRSQPIENSVVVHIRRGNFRRSPSNGILSSEYMTAALKRLSPGQKQVLLLSDDHPSQLTDVLAQLRYSGYTCEVVRDGHLMTARDSLAVLGSAKALVLANSTLSWWGARLNLNRQVVRPSEWLRSKEYAPNLNLPGTFVQPVSYDDSLSTSR